MIVSVPYRTPPLLPVSVTRRVERRLDRWGVPFEAILDHVRRIRALELLRSGQYSMTDIALLLGYFQNAHFTWAFRRWTGMSPRRYAKPAD
jgi:AraC-like DNA-binding protein